MFKIFNLDPKFSLALKRLGVILYRHGKTDEAIKLYRDWLELDPDNAVVKHMLAACSGGDTPERASEEYLEKTFDDFAASFDKKLESLEYKAPQLIAGTVKAQMKEQTARLAILDAGCGTGLCGPLLKPVANRLSGVDLSKNMLELANERKCYDELTQEDLVRHIDRFTGEFDVIVSADTLVYFGELKQVFEAAAKALKTGGLFIFSLERLPANDSARDYKLLMHGRYAHDRLYIEKTASNAGLELVSISEEVLRMELKLPVDGWVVTLKKQNDWN